MVILHRTWYLTLSIRIMSSLFPLRTHHLLIHTHLLTLLIQQHLLLIPVHQLLFIHLYVYILFYVVRWPSILTHFVKYTS
jgi:hypothetical protein